MGQRVVTTTQHNWGSVIYRTVWRHFGVIAFRCTFHNWYSVRRLVLSLFGAHVERTARIRPTARFNCPWNLTVGDHAAIGDYAIIDSSATVTIGARSTISQYACLCTSSNDPDRPDAPPRPIVIGDDCWIAADVYVAAGVTIEHDTVVGSRSTVFDSLPERSICVGDRAKRIGHRPWKHDHNSHAIGGAK